MFKISSKYALLSKHLKCSVWKLAVRYDINIYMSLGDKGLMTETSRPLIYN